MHEDVHSHGLILIVGLITQLARVIGVESARMHGTIEFEYINKSSHDDDTWWISTMRVATLYYDEMWLITMD